MLNKKSIFIALSLLLLASNKSFSNDILKDGIITGILTSPTIAANDLTKSLPLTLLLQTIGIAYTKPSSIESFAKKLMVSMSTWAACNYFVSSINKNKSNHSHSHECDENCNHDHR